MKEPYLNVYDTDGNLLSSTYLEEIAKALEEPVDDNYIAYIHAFGDYVGIFVPAIAFSEMRCYLYNLSDNSLIAIEDYGCYYLDTYKSIGAETENHILYAIDSDAEGFAYNIYSLDNSGEITALAESAENFKTDGKTVVYFKDDILYKIVL